MQNVKSLASLKSIFTAGLLTTACTSAYADRQETSDNFVFNQLKSSLLDADQLFLSMPLASQHGSNNHQHGFGGLTKGEEFDEINPGLIFGVGWDNVLSGSVLSSSVGLHAGAFDNSFKDGSVSQTAYVDIYPDLAEFNVNGVEISGGLFGGVARYEQLDRTMSGDLIPVGGLTGRFNHISSGIGFEAKYIPGSAFDSMDITTFSLQFRF